MKWQIAIVSDIGDRPDQQDRVSALVKGDNEEIIHLMLLADGMGGHEDGALAAQTVMEVAARQLHHKDIDDVEGFLNQLMLQSHIKISRLKAESAHPPGATCVALYMQNNEAYWAHVGDSRLYHLHQGKCVTTTNDHSVNDAQNQHQLHMCLGGKNAIAPDFGASIIADGDVFYLCSDGFWSLVDSHEVCDMLKKYDELQQVADQLLALAKSRAENNADNISLLITRCQQEAVGSAKKSWLNRLLKR